MILSVRSAITCDFSDLGSTGMSSGKADTAVDTRSLSDPENFILHLRYGYLDLDITKLPFPSFYGCSKS